jgi:hypothetical protein
MRAGSREKAFSRRSKAARGLKRAASSGRPPRRSKAARSKRRP